MKKIILRISLLLLITFLLNTTLTNANDSWQHIDRTTIGNIFFNTKSFKTLNTSSNQTYSVWIKWEWSEEYAKELAKKLSLEKPIAFSLEKWEIDYTNEKMRTLATVHYDKDGKSLFSHEVQTKWYTIIPDSVGEVVSKTTYDYYIKYYKK